MSCFSVFNLSVATSRKRDIVYNIIFVVYFNYVLAGFDSQRFLIFVMHSFLIENCFFKPTTSTLFIQKKSTTQVNRKGRIKILQTLGVKNMFFSYMFISSKVQAFQEQYGGMSKKNLQE